MNLLCAWSGDIGWTRCLGSLLYFELDFNVIVCAVLEVSKKMAQQLRLHFRGCICGMAKAVPISEAIFPVVWL